MLEQPVIAEDETTLKVVKEDKAKSQEKTLPKGLMLAQYCIVCRKWQKRTD
jgi:hypothetical protein